MTQPYSCAYVLLFNETLPDDIPAWKAAERILNHFVVPVLGEELARTVILEIVNHTTFPSNDLTRKLVLRAESFASELWDDLSDEPHMAELDRLEYLQTVEKRGR
jgi:hypothetical protein